jgi:hypothetical protein
MLSHMYGTAGDGLHDHLIMCFTRAVTGATFLLPHCHIEITGGKLLACYNQRETALLTPGLWLEFILSGVEGPD